MAAISGGVPRATMAPCTSTTISVAKRNTSRDGSDYRDYYTSKTLRIVADWYKADIDAFGFDFDSGATRGTVYGD